MPEELPWELMRDSISSFAHDSANYIQGALLAIARAARISKNPELRELEREANRIGISTQVIHQAQFLDFRRSESPPKNLDKMLALYRRALRRRNKRINIVIGKVKAFCRENQNKLNEETMNPLNRALRRLDEYQTHFSAEQLGRKIEVNAKPGNICAFLKELSREKFVDRDGKSVRVVFRGKNIGNVSFDRFLLWRSINNLLTDALNHSPGRPIFVTLNARNGHAVINVTNQGQKLRPEEIAKIGRVRFTRAWHDPKRGYGKISTRLLTEAQGGTFRAGNSRIGPMLSITMPRIKMARRR